MIVIENVETATGYLLEGYRLAKTTADYPNMPTECRVAGMLMGLTQADWWFTLLRPHTTDVCAIVNKRMFIELYQHFYIEAQHASDADSLHTFVLNNVCPIQEFPRYQRKLDSWRESVSNPGDPAGHSHFG